MHSVILESLTSKSDLKAIVGAISNILNVDKRGAIEHAKNLPLTLAKSLPENEAKLMADMLGNMGAGVRVEPPLGKTTSEAQGEAPPEREVRELVTELPRRGINIGCLIFIMLCLAGFATFASMNYEWILDQFKPSPEKAERALQKGNVMEARRSIQKQLRENPGDANLLVLQGKSYIGSARKRMNSEKWKSFGEAGAMPEIDTAVAIFRKAEAGDPKNSSIPRWISIAEQMRKYIPQAETAARRAVAVDPQDVDNWNQLGSVLIDMEQITQAEQAFNTALRIDGNNAAALKNMAILNLYYTKDAGRASKYLLNYFNQKNADVDMDSWQLRTDLTTAMIGDFNQPWDRLSPPQLPFEEYERRRAKIAENPGLNNDPLMQEQLGLLYMSKGEKQAAEDCFIRAIQLNKSVEPARKMLAIMYMKEFSYEKALKTMQAAVENGARDPFFWKNIGVLQKYYKMNPAEATKAFNRYFATGGDFFEARIKKEM
jgi:tetratricopeptide (TPR) repeat protein